MTAPLLARQTSRTGPHAPDLAHGPSARAWTEGTTRGRPILAASRVEALKSTAADLVRRSRVARRLPARVTGVRHRPVHYRLRAVPGTDVADIEPAAATVTTDGVVLRVFGAISRSALRSEALAAARRTSVEALWVLRRFLILALVAVGMAVPLATIGATELRAAVHAVTLEPQNAVEATWAAADARSEASTPDPAGLRVHVQTQAFLRAGGQRQFRLAVDGTNGLDRPDDASVVHPPLQVDLAIDPQRSAEGSVAVTPTQLVVTRNELISTPIWIQVAADVPCGSDLGELHVHVRELASDRSQGATTVTLPPIDCREAPPAIGERR